jgi:hypothetical protein
MATISEANRIFGFDGWSRETLESRKVLSRETRGTFLAIYIARCVSRSMPPERPLFAKAMVLAKPMVPRPLKRTTSH